MPKFDFSGYATKNNLRCSDGRTIRKNAFKDNDGQTVPLVWQHVHSDPSNVLGHALLENREDGVYAYCKFNDTDAGKNAKALVQHGDITALSIYANQLKQKGSDVLHGAIREVSLVMAGANPGALIDNLSIAHADGTYTDSEDEAVIYTGLNFSNKVVEHSIDDDEDYEEEDEGEMQHADEDNRTIADVFNTLNEEQKNVVYAMIAQALDGDDEEGEEEMNHSDEGGTNMKKNVFDNQETESRNVLSHDQLQVILADAQKCGSLKDAVLAHAVEYGIENIDILFPDAKTLAKDPDWLKREDDWVAGVLSAIHHSPFSRVKSIIADMDFDEARAKGYVKATEKKETYFKVAKRVTTPTTIYVKQKLDRDDIIDVTDFDIVAMVRFELRTLLNEELAKAALFGDGRDPGDKYKINEENIRPIWKDEELYSIKERVSTETDYKKMVKEISLTHKRYKGTGSPVFYTTPDIHTNMLWIEDTNGRRIYESDATLCAALRVSKIVEIPSMEGLVRTGDNGKQMKLLGIKVNLKDYNFGADKGGEVATFDDFDIDFNQYKYLMETRCSGALTRPKSAQIYEIEVAAPANNGEAQG